MPLLMSINLSAVINNHLEMQQQQQQQRQLLLPSVRAGKAAKAAKAAASQWPLIPHCTSGRDGGGRWVRLGKTALIVVVVIAAA